MRRELIIVTALGLAACDRSEQAPPQPQQDAFEQRLRALNESGRNLAFRNAIRDNEVGCERVDRSAFQETVKGAGMWVAHCTDTGDFALFVSKTGFAQVTRCSDLPRGPAPACKPLSAKDPAAN